MTGYRLLYIDDDPGLCRFVQRQLERDGYAIDVATSGEAGLARLLAGGVDVVALDHYMPGQDGLETLDLIRALPDPPPVILVTGTSESRVAVAALKAGASDYVVKDVEGEFMELLGAAIRSAIVGVRLKREKEAADREVRAARDRFEALAAERQVLLREVNHRVGNSLQLVAAFLHMQANGAAGPETRAALGEATRRVLAVAQVHRRLYASDDVSSIALNSYLAGLIDDIRSSTDALNIGELLSLDADEVMVDADSAVTIGIIVTELVINAMKYAYPDASGPIRVTLKADGGPRSFLLAVEDDGVGKAAAFAGPLDGAPDGSPTAGLGRTIIKAMASKLATAVSYEPGGPGTRAVMPFSLPEPG